MKATKHITGYEYEVGPDGIILARLAYHDGTKSCWVSTGCEEENGFCSDLLDWLVGFATRNPIGKEVDIEETSPRVRADVQAESGEVESPGESVQAELPLSSSAQSQGGEESELARTYLAQLRRLLGLKYRRGPDLNDTGQQLLDKAITARYIDCCEVGAGKRAEALLTLARTSPQDLGANEEG